MERDYKTDRLIIKTIGTSDADAKLVSDYFIRNREHLKPWDPYRKEEFFTVESRKSALIWEQEEMLKETYIRLWIFKKDDSKFQKINGLWEDHIILSLVNKL